MRSLEMTGPKTDLAEERTDLAEDRTILANERTFAGWFRTGFAGIGIGLAFNALFNRVEPPWLIRAIATIFLLISIGIFIAAERRACAVLGRLNAHKVVTVSIFWLRLMTIGAVVATTALTAAIWLLNFDPSGE